MTGKDRFVVREAFAIRAHLKREADALAAHGIVTTALVLCHSAHQSPLVQS